MTAKIKLNAASGGGSFSLQAPSSSSNNRVISLPDIADGTLVTSQSTLDATKLSGDLPAISGANLTGIAGGISELDCWRINSTFQGDAYHITTNWERFDDTGEGKKGTGMVEDNGIFNFPSTGHWYIEWSPSFYRGAGSAIYNQYAHIRTTTNNASYSERARGVGSMYSESGNSGSGAHTSTIFKCSNTSTHKVIFGVEVGNQYVYTYGSTSNNFSHAIFIKLADL